MPSEICRGPCNARYRRAQADYTAALSDWHTARAARHPDDPEPARPDPVTLRPWDGAPVWCPRCQAQIRRELAELDDLASIITATADGHRTAADSDTRVTRSPAPPSPSPAADDIDELASMLRGWESAARGEDPKPRRGYLATEITTTVSWLVTHYDPMITNPDYAADFGTEIRAWHKRLARRAKAGTGKTPRHLPCPRCQHRALCQDQGADYIECLNCGRLMSMDEYDTEVEEQHRRQNLPASPAAA